MCKTSLQSRKISGTFAPAAVCSIIIPIYNRQDTITETVESCIAQDYPAIEVILVDDGSTDRSAEICDQLSNKKYMERKKVRWTQQVNSGACAARNTGMMLATGEYILFLDSDDTIPPNKLSTQISAMEYCNADCSISDFMTVNEVGTQMTTYRNNLAPHEFITKLKSPSNSAIIMRRSTIPHKMRWNTSLKRMQDFDFMLRYLSGVKSWSYVPEPLYHYRIHNGSRISDSYLEGMPYFQIFVSMARHLRRNPPAAVSSTELLSQYALRLSYNYLKDLGSRTFPNWIKERLKRALR